MNLINNLYLRFTFSNSIQNWNNVGLINKIAQCFYVYLQGIAL